MPLLHIHGEETFGAPDIQAYAMTEAARQITSNPLSPGRRKPGTAGVAAQRLAAFKFPERIVFVTDIPKDPTGRLRGIGLAEPLRLNA